jgi:peptidoglycan/LPS O-acetylase OafA/YrhL
VSGQPGNRADIDGLRALAVLPVILFHARVPGFAGGYIGVDVFFVISGYLITRLLARGSHMTLRAALADFYLRRARRILPALTLMLFVVAVAAWCVLLPMDLERFGRFLAYAVVFLGNYVAWNSGGYFDTSSAALVHLWSIGIEEQFYLLYPLVYLAWLRADARRGRLLLWSMAAASMAWCLAWMQPHPSVNFYAPMTRAWELLLGAIAAHAHWSGPARTWANELLAWMALIVLVSCLAWFDRESAHPGLVTLVPCVATLLLLVTGAARATSVTRLLMLRPLVFTGLISYSLYLWHAPVLSLARYWSMRGFSAVQLIALLAAIYVLAAASWHFVEQPVRTKQWLRSNVAFSAVFAGATALLLAAGLVMWRSHGMPGRFDAEVRLLTALPAPIPPEVGRCMTLAPDRVAAGDLCAFGSANAKRSVVLWGDSHALMLLPAFRALNDGRTQLFFAGHSSCHPLLGHAELPSALLRQTRALAECARFNEAMIVAIGRLAPDVVILSGYWNLPEDTGSTRARLAQSLDATLSALRPARSAVCVALDVPTQVEAVPYMLAMAHRRGLPEDGLRLTLAQATAQQAGPDAVFVAARASGRVAVLDPKPALCGSGVCSVRARDGRPLYIDSNHVSAATKPLLSAPLSQCVLAAMRLRGAP